jgi:hypothetical protein
MQHRVTGIRSAIVASTLIVGAFVSPWAIAPAAPQSAQPAQSDSAQTGADTCLSKPGKTTPRGRHWYYRIERPSGRRCWYLGLEKSKARQAPRAEETDAPPATADQPSPPPKRASAEGPAVAPPPRPVTAAPFSAIWPPILKPQTAENSVAPDSDAAQARSQATADEVDTQAEEMPLVWPILTAEELAAVAEPSTPIGLGHLLILLAAVAVFTAIACRAILKLTSAWLRQRRRNLYSTPITELPEQIMPWQQRMIEAAQEHPGGWQEADPLWRTVDLAHRRPWAANDEYEDGNDVRRRQAVA